MPVRKFFCVLIFGGASSLSISCILNLQGIQNYLYPSPNSPVESSQCVSHTVVVTQQEGWAFTSPVQGEVIITQPGFGVYGQEVPRENCEAVHFPRASRENFTWQGCPDSSSPIPPTPPQSPKPHAYHLQVFLEWGGIFRKLNGQVVGFLWIWEGRSKFFPASKISSCEQTRVMWSPLLLPGVGPVCTPQVGFVHCFVLACDSTCWKALVNPSH